MMSDTSDYPVRHLFLALSVLTAAVASGGSPGFAQQPGSTVPSPEPEVTDALPSTPVIRSVHWVGHTRLDDAHALPDGRWISLGDEGLTILWDSELRPVSWIRTVGTRVLDVSVDAVMVGSGSQSQHVRVNDDGTLVASPPTDHAAVVACEGGGWWAWSEDESVLTLRRGTLEESWEVTTGAAAEARCVTTSAHASLYWPDADRVRIVSTAHAISEPFWQLAQAVLQPTAADQFVLLGLSDDGQLQGVRSADGVALAGAELEAVGAFRLGSCGAFDEALHEGCPGIPSRVARALVMPHQLIPFDVLVSGSWMTLVGSVAAMQLQWDSGVAEPSMDVGDQSSAGVLVIYEAEPAVGAGPDQTAATRWTACRRTPTGLEVVEATGAVGSVSYRIQAVDACPDGWWSAAAGDDGLLWTSSDADGAEVRSPVLGRNGLSFVASPRWEPSCGTPAWTVYRSTSELEPTPISEPMCGRSMRFQPLWNPAQQVVGTVALLERESGQWVALSYNFVGDALVRASFEDAPELTTRFVLAQEDLCMLAPHRRTPRCWNGERWRGRDALELGGSPVFQTVAAGVQLGAPVNATFLGGPQAWVLWSETRLQAASGALARVVVEWSDGVLIRGDDPLVETRLAAAQRQNGGRNNGTRPRWTDSDTD